MKHQIANYMYSAPLSSKRVGSTTYTIGYADAYNAFGLIGPEHNGIFVLDATHRAVVLDQHMIASTGYFGPRPEHIAEIARLRGLAPKAFLAWIRGHARTRDEYR